MRNLENTIRLNRLRRQQRQQQAGNTASEAVGTDNNTNNNNNSNNTMSNTTSNNNAAVASGSSSNNNDETMNNSNNNANNSNSNNNDNTEQVDSRPIWGTVSDDIDMTPVTNNANTNATNNNNAANNNDDNNNINNNRERRSRGPGRIPTNAATAASMDDDIEDEVINLVDSVQDVTHSTEDRLRNMHKLAHILETHEKIYHETTNEPYLDTRDDYNIGRLLTHVHEDFIDAVIQSYMIGDARLVSAALRLVLAAGPRVPTEMLVEDTFLRRITEWVKTAELPNRAYATGILALAMVDPHLSATLAKSGDLVVLLLQRLKDYVYGKSNGITSSETVAAAAESNNTSAAAAASESDNTSVQIPTTDELHYLELLSILQCIGNMGEYSEVFAPVIREGGLDMVITLLQTRDKDRSVLFETLRLVLVLLCNKKFANMFIDRGGLKLLLNLPRVPYIAGGVGPCIVSFAAIVPLMEKIYSKTPKLIEAMVQYGFFLLDTPVDELKRHGAVFFHYAFCFRSVIELFDKMNGLSKLLNVVRYAISFPHEASSDVKETARCVCKALVSYFRMYVVMAGNSISSKKAHVKQKKQDLYKKAVEINTNSVTNALDVLTKNRTAALNIISQARWRCATKFMESDGIYLILAVLQASSHWRNVDVAHTALDVLELLALAPFAHLPLSEQTIDSGKTGMQLIIEAAAGDVIDEVDIIRGALQVLCNLTCHPLGCADPSSAVHKQIWKRIRSHNGIKVLVDQLRFTDPPSHADSVRLLACKALNGLSRDHTICQILTEAKVGSVLSELIKEPVSAENASLFENFKTCALELIRKTTRGAQTHESVTMEAADPTPLRLEKSAIVADTHISYPQKELLQLIHEYLKEHGLQSTAESLLKEASIAPAPPRPPKDVNCNNSNKKHNHKMNANDDEEDSTRLHQIVVQYLRQQHRECHNPISIVPPFSLFKPHACPTPHNYEKASSNITKRILTRNVQTTLRRPIGFGSGSYGLYHHKHDRRLIYSRFRHVRTYKNEDDPYTATCAVFDSTGSKLFVGSEFGSMDVYDVLSQEKKASFELAQEPVIGMRLSRDSSTLLTWGAEECRLWNAKTMKGEYDFSAPLHTFAACRAAVFSNGQDQIVTTSAKQTCIYDVLTGDCKVTLADRKVVPPGDFTSENYVAVFSPYDELVLSDRTLWDPRIPPRVIHRFDKLTNYGSGVFHPSGNEVIINSEVWDLRTFKLLRSIPALDQTQIQFSPLGDVIYAVVKNYENDMLNPITPIFRTLDSADFETISTIELDKEIIDLGIDPTDNFISVVEAQQCQAEYGLCRLYEIGRKRRQRNGDNNEDDDEDSDYTATDEESETDVDDVDEDEDLDEDMLDSEDDLMDFFNDDESFVEGEDGDEAAIAGAARGTTTRRTNGTTTTTTATEGGDEAEIDVDRDDGEDDEDDEDDDIAMAMMDEDDYDDEEVFSDWDDEEFEDFMDIRNLPFRPRGPRR